MSGMPRFVTSHIGSNTGGACYHEIFQFCVEVKVSACICAVAHCCFPAYRNIFKSSHKGWMGSQSIRYCWSTHCCLRWSGWKVNGEKREEDGHNHDNRWEEMKTLFVGFAIAGSHKTKKQKAQTIQPRYPQTRQRRAIAQQSPATANKGKTYEKVCGMWQQIPTIWFKAIMTTRKGLQNRMQNTDTRIHTKIHHKCLQQFKSRNQATVTSHHLFQGSAAEWTWAEKMVWRNVLSLFVCAATK